MDWNGSGIGAHLVGADKNAKLVIEVSPGNVITSVDAAGYAIPPLVFDGKILLVTRGGAYCITATSGERLKEGQLNTIVSTLVKFDNIDRFGAVVIENVDGTAQIYLAMLQLLDIGVKELRRVSLPFFGRVVRAKRES